MTRSFSVVSSNKFIGVPDGNVISWCPTMDLLTVSMNKMSVWVFRLNGERIYSINNKAFILSLDWNPNGKYFCVSGIDKVVKIYDSNSGKFLSTIGESKDGINLPIGLVKWGTTSIKDSMVFKLAKVDVLRQLPKLHHEIELNDLINVHPLETISPVSEELMLDYLIMVKAHSIVTITFNGKFTVDDIELPAGHKYLDHITDQDVFSHYFLTKDSNDKLNLIHMQLAPPRAYVQNKELFIETILNFSKMSSLIDNIDDQLAILTAESKPFVSLIDRHLSNFKDSVYQDVDLTTNFPTPQELECKILNVLHDILLTNLIPNNLKDYWLNQLGDRGLKKVTKVGNTLYDAIRKTVFSQVVLSLEKLVVILTNMQGLSKWFDESPSENEKNFGLSSEAISTLLGICQDLIKLSYRLIWDINEEQKLFNKFLNWCKVEVVDKLAHEDDIESYFNNHQAQTYKSSEIMNYFNDYLFKPKVFEYFKIDCSMNDILLQDDTKPEILQKLTGLQQAFGDSLSEKFEQFFRSIVRYDDAIPLDIPDVSNTNMKIIDGKIVLSGVKDTSVHFVKFDIDSQAQESSSVDFSDDIIAYKLLEKGNLIVLHGNDLKKLELVDQNETVQSLEFNADSYVSDPKHIAVNEARSIGCVLDSSRQKYVIFNL